MTDAKNTTTNKKENKGGGFVKFMNSIPRAFFGWINALMGRRTMTSSQPSQTETPPADKMPDKSPKANQLGKKIEGEFVDELQEDSVVKDLESFKKFTKKAAAEAEEKLKPILTKVEKKSDKYLGEARGRVEKMQTQMAQKQTQSISPETTTSPSVPVKTIFSELPVKKVLIIVLLVGLIFVIISVASRFLSQNGGENGNGKITVTLTPEPSINIPAPETSSIYATDPEVLQIEENINVLDGEMSRTLLKETTLNPPPKLDFDVRF